MILRLRLQVAEAVTEVTSAGHRDGQTRFESAQGPRSAGLMTGPGGHLGTAVSPVTGKFIDTLALATCQFRVDFQGSGPDMVTSVDRRACRSLTGPFPP